MNKKYYFDYAATTPIAPEVAKEMLRVMQEVVGNPSSIHNFGREAANVLEGARRKISNLLKVSPEEIIFNSGGTEGNNTAIFGIAQQRKADGKHIITTPVEHHSVSLPIRKLEEEGFEVTILSVNEQGEISLEELKNSLREDTILVSVMAVNNELGNLYPVQAIGELLKDTNATFHVDAVQALGHFDIFPKDCHIDTMSFSAHKINGPRGVGFLYKDAKVSFSPLVLGGEQERKLRAGTENVAGILGMVKAFEIHQDKATQKQQLESYKSKVLNALEASDVVFEVNGNLSNQSPHILNLFFPNVSNNILLVRLDLEGIAVSTGSACSAGNVEDSETLVAMFGERNKRVKESIRLSFDMETTDEEIEYLCEVLVKNVSNLQKKL